MRGIATAKKVLASFLCAAMTITFIPARVLATEQGGADLVETPKQEPSIVEEISSGRNEYGKEFLMDNGLHMAVVYPQAVHYQENGSWREIDNTLTLNSEDGAYHNRAGVWDVSLPAALDTISLTHNGHTLEFRLIGLLRDESVETSEDGKAEDKAALQQVLTEVKATTAELLPNEFKERDAQRAVFEKNVSAIAYRGIETGTDLRYDLVSNKLKESIIIDAYKNAPIGYRYALNTDLTLDLQEDGQILAIAEDLTDPVFYLPAPYLYDSVHAFCDEIEIQLEKTDSGYLLTYLLPQKWLADTAREYPVVLDPVVQPNSNTYTIEDQSVSQYHNLNYLWGLLEMGYFPPANNGGARERVFIKFKDIPNLTSADMIVGAKLCLKKSDSTRSGVVEAHQVIGGTWSSQTITWNTMPAVKNEVEDYQSVSAAGDYYWDITCSAQFWYSSGMNTGVMLRMPDDVENGSTQRYVQFYSSDYSPYVLPLLQLYYINNCGLEDIWDYTTQSAGRAGTGYVNDYTGNLVWVHQGLGFAGNRMPVSVNAIYNANDKGNNNFGLGYGWRTNYNQLVYQWSVNSNYYVWEDADGTRHYFLYNSSSGKYVDELNAKRTLTTTGSGNTKYHLYDEENYTDSYFDTYGRLTQISNRQATVSSVTVTYANTTGSKLITYVTDGVGRRYQFSYNGTVLQGINFLGTGSTALSGLTYGQSDNQLTSISYPDSKTVYFTYSSNHLLASAQDVDGYKVAYTYNIYTTAEPNRVNNIKEYSGSTLGGELQISYAHNQTILTDAVNNKKEILQFNNWGSTLSVQNSLGQATFSRYVNQNSGAGDNGKTGSQLALASKLQNTVINLLDNGNVEYNRYWTSYSANPSTGSWSYTTAQKYSGNRALSITNTAASAYRVQGNSAVTLTANKSYTLSAYVKTGTLTGGDGAKLALAASGSATALASSETVPSGTDWTRVEVTYTPTASVAVVPCLINDASGTAYFDCVQWEESPSASRYNLVENGDVRYTDGWIAGAGQGSGEGRWVCWSSPAPAADTYALCQLGNVQGDKYFYQNIPISGSAGDTFTLSGWSMGAAVARDSAKTRRYGLMLRFNYTNGTTGDFYVDFNPDLEPGSWQYAACQAVAANAYSSVQVRVLYMRDQNSAFFDAIQLFKEEFGQSYTYDSNGNVISTIDLQKQQTNYTYSNNNLVKIALGSGTNAPAYTYTYDSYHNVTSATTPEGVVTTLTYDTYGNNTKVTQGTSPKIEASATYTSDGNLLSKITLPTGNTITYDYDTETGTLNWERGSLQGTNHQTNYTHDSLYRITGVTQGNGSVSYTYNGSDLLSVLTNGSGTDYTFSYNSWAQPTSISAGNHTLITNTYTADRNRRLSQSTYGNGDSLSYTYDSFGRVSSRTWEDGDTVSYTYDANGNVGKVTDSGTGRTTKNYYDFLDRLMRYDETGSNYSNSVRWGYDVKNRLTSQTQILNGTTYTTGYTYDNDNRVTSMVQGDISAEYTYDSLGRITGVTDKNGTSTVVDTAITYRPLSNNRTNTQVETFSNTVGGNTTTYTYSYQPRNNVYRIYDGTDTISFVYTLEDVLTRENNPYAGKTWYYTYDGSGNILTKQEYAYTVSATLPNSPQSTITYTYGDSTWGDLLTAYNGQPLTYDEIGNLTDDGTWEYTWEHGRQLSSMTDGTTAISYAYNADGLRISKTVDSVTYNYVYVGSTLTDMTWGNNSMHFVYDALGAAAVIYNGTTYYYLRNAQGDIVGIVDSTGTQVVAYSYDVWGKLLTTTGTMATTLGQNNPLRYRGYVYDTETGLYYLTSRYYNPTWGRFINEDGYVSTGQGILGNNMFAYCLNNPIRFADDSGCRCIEDQPDGRWVMVTNSGKVVSGGRKKQNVKPIEPYSSIGNGISNVYIIQSKQLEETNKIINEKDVVVIDNRTAPNPSMQIRNSYTISDKDLQKQVCQILLHYNTDNPVDPAWNRSIDSMLIEWTAHNDGYNARFLIGLFKKNATERLRHVDLDNAAEGLLYWDYLGK